MAVLKTLGTITVALVALFIYSLKVGGVYHPIQCTLFGVQCPPRPTVEGTTIQKYEPLIADYQAIFNRGDDLVSCFAVYKGDEKLVDLCAGNVTTAQGVKPFRNTVQNVFSSTKTLVKIVVAMLVDRGLVEYDKPVATYWPEYAAGNKESVTISDIMCHASGITWLDEPIPWDIIGNDEHLDELASYFAKQPHNFGGKRTMGYHAIQYGSIINEVVRRVDPQKRTIAEFATQEIIDPLGVEFYFGLPAEKEAELFNIFKEHPSYNILVKTLPRTFVDIPFLPSLGDDKEFFKNAMLDKNAILHKSNPSRIFGEGAPLGDPNTQEFFQSKHWRGMKHLSACNGFSNALAMAKMGQIMTFGVVDGKHFLKPETIQKALEPLAKEKDVYFYKSVVRTKGGFVLHEIVSNGKKHDVYGWSGMGGSLFMFDPKEKFSFGYVPAVQGGQFVELDVRSKEMLTKFYEK